MKTLGETNPEFVGKLVQQLFAATKRGPDEVDDQELFSTLATLNGAKAIGAEREIGSLEVGKKADLVLHDTDLPEWGPVFDPVTQLALSAPASGVHSVWIDGVQVIDDGRATLIDEARLLADARAAGAAIIARTGLPAQTPWPVV